MISRLFAQHISDEFPYKFTPIQAEAAEAIGAFLGDPRTDQAFILRGYAGTGKTSLVAAVVRVWQMLQRPVILLAPTGRAAKVFSMHAGQPAFTIHKTIYRQQTFNGEETIFNRGWNTLRDALFIIDEASMISNQGGNSIFGTGMLLDDLVQFVYGGTNCRLMMVGDTAQLPPVGEEESPALHRETLEAYGLYVREAELTEVVRQEKASAVLRNATYLRQHISLFDGSTVRGVYSNDADAYGAVNENGMPLVTVGNHTEVRTILGDELIDALESSYREWGTDDTIIVTRSNKRANIYNQGIRSRIFDYEDVLTRGDRVMAVKNNYFWNTQNAALLPESKTPPMAFIANGDSAEVVHFHNLHEMHGFTFADVTLRFSDYDDLELDCRVLIDTLTSDSPSLSPEQASQLYEAVYADYADIKNRRDRMKAIRKDPYYNALQIKYAYAITCHKAQGGQWHEVYIDQGYLGNETDPVAYLRWLYTAFTRTSGNLYLVNWPKAQTQIASGKDTHE